MLRDTCHGGTRCPQRVGDTDAALPPVICAFSESFAIGPSRTGIFGEADPPLSSKPRSCLSPQISAAKPAITKYE
jgi:hypothetical protein